MALLSNHQRAARSSAVSAGAIRARRKFLHYFPGGYRDPTYIDWERGYKQAAHERWEESLNEPEWRSLLRRGEYVEAASRAVRIESRTNLLFSFEKMALRDAVKTNAGAKIFAKGLFDFVHGHGSPQRRLENWIDAVESLPRRQTRVLTWPMVTIFGFIADPNKHIFLKPNVTKVAAKKYGFDFAYQSRPNWETYASYLDFAEAVRKDNRQIMSLRPRDMIDLQSFIWVQGSDEYPD
jgi:hypothetical protein